MALSDSDIEFLQENHSAAMITMGADGLPKAVRVGVVLVDGKLWSSGTEDRVRTRRLRQDPRCVLYVYDKAWSFLTLETTVTVLDGPDVPRQSVRLFREMQGRPTGPLLWGGTETDEEAFVQAMVDEARVIYEFDVHRTYGLQA